MNTFKLYLLILMSIFFVLGCGDDNPVDPDNTTPSITTIERNTVLPGDEMLIKGKNFGSERWLSKVYFDNLVAEVYVSWSDTLIKVTVPSITKNGSVKVVKTEGYSNSVSYTLDNGPRIKSIVNGNIFVGDYIKISGNNFGDIQDSSYVDFDGIKGDEYSLWTNDSIKVKVPLGTKTGFIRVYKGTQVSNAFPITIFSQQPDPVITSLNKTTFTAEETISITGKNFGNSKADNANVYFNGIPGTEYLIWESTLIKVKVPITATSGKLLVKIGYQVSNTIDYLINSGDQSPVITGINPVNASVSQVVYISGKYFGGSTGGDSYVMFGNVKASEIISWNSIEIGVKVPNVPTGETEVVVYSGDKPSNKWNITIESKPVELVPVVEIPPGTYYMGSNNISNLDAYPQHKVTLSKPLMVGKYEITQAAYKKVMNQSNPSRIKDNNNPVEQITWLQAVDFCNRLSKLEGLTECYIIDGPDVTCNWSASGYRLLTESEWEYACRAGSAGNYGKLKGAEGELNKMGWNANNTQEIKNVGLLQANDFGIYDMHGNAAEWVWDYYDLYESEDKTDPAGPSDGVERCIRGGGYIDSPTRCSNFARESANQSQFQYYIGFRVCRRK